MKKILPALVLFVCLCQTSFSQITIAEARVLPGGSVVTVKGLVLNGSELGDIRYIQDNTGNIAAYAPTILDVVLRGDSIQVTGPLFNYNGLLEISTATSVTVLNSGNPLPSPTDVTCISGYVEGYEAKLVRVNAALFADSSKVRQASSNRNLRYRQNIKFNKIRIPQRVALPIQNPMLILE